MTDQEIDRFSTNSPQIEEPENNKIPPLAKVMLGILALMTMATIGAIIYLGLTIIEKAGEIL